MFDIVIEGARGLEKCEREVKEQRERTNKRAGGRMNERMNERNRKVAIKRTDPGPRNLLPTLSQYLS